MKNSRYDIKNRLYFLDVTMSRLYLEIKKRGFSTLSRTTFSLYVNGIECSQRGDTVLALADKIVTEWEQEKTA